MALYALYIFGRKQIPTDREAMVRPGTKASALPTMPPALSGRADRSGTGTVYYVEQPDGWYESDPMDQMDYVAWEAEALEQSQRLTRCFFPLTEENIMALEN